MRHLLILGTAALLAGSAIADVQVSERRALKDTLKAGGQQSGNRTGTGQPPGRTGEQPLIDASGLEYFINTDITFTTSSSASGAASEASYTAAVNADTSGGGSTSTTLTDSFDGYGARCVSLTGGTGPCVSGGGGDGPVEYIMYNQNGVAALECNGRQVVTPSQTIGPFSVTRKIFVPASGEFIRWMDIVTNTSGASASLNLISSNNLGSDAGTTIVTSSDSDATAEAADTWLTSFQAFSGSTSSDVRLGHVFQGAGAPVPMAGISFVNGDDNPFWRYAMTVGAGQTQIIVNFATGQPTRAEAAAAATALAAAPSTECMTQTEIDQIANFALNGPPPPNVLEVPTASTYGLIALGLLLSVAAFGVLRRR
ncbi:MAG: hypothetical protein SF066_11505 [Thermoanaerobaculia bacterium]|nr:hypothetical protein [Thermoanaerobaculia bacterium]